MSTGSIDPEVLVLGGTRLARQLARTLTDAGISALTSLAGRTRAPRQLPGPTRHGGFGGVEGLARWLHDNRPRVVVNATHAFAATISAHAARACRRADLPLARLVPTSWAAQPDAATWIWVADNASAVRVVRALPDPVLLTVGRQATAEYLALGDRDITHRVIDAPDEGLPPRWRLLNARGPFSEAAEEALMDDPGHRIATLVTKDSGGDQPAAKLVVAARTGARVVMIARPPVPDYGIVLHDVADTLDWVRSALG
ncbi:cobalt-precorrin-6A reductase [Propionibacterium freudenreichii]|uniref:Precorrin-6x reductase cobK n=2 Tax=Propionibacterium freudenreichii TaxID=1744 RepID=A0A2C6YJJ5_9ACTN|nr:cobalt-precorrin-6A reductase [Propionibacterium freudenreichii]AJQ90469.1 Precorrin-6x reductase CbiJ/CobK [Propionibacterium freudenreichii subsp. freudenreichii]MCT2981381.1 cobalt-precorrin-6A reductase [Propionibacterium freudenreichii]MCT3002941.1 cobalt-precorrin-6A reductase [Propionibacterium freudenreichii]MCT3013735.1 cobalt-precorrin-6A reductase [Propionibacterium freudenreichii]MDK9341274.1 cobalt-precorrin-6A reductase [Propionibacterium freudenreichii]